ncbi:MAG: hypothetical protein ITG00_05130, partial [Flavobacterium sp.]|nr:hypothetical protein [Flavobacterium sp.]
MKIGVYSIGSQSGLAYFADLTSQGYTVVGFARQSTHGTIMADTVREQGGVWLERPVNSNNEPSRFVELGNSIVSQNLADFTGCLFIILAIPSHYHVEVAAELKAAGILNSNIPLI